MATTGTAMLDERNLRKELTVTVRVVQRPSSRVLTALGLWVVKVGLYITGVGRVVIEDAD